MKFANWLVNYLCKNTVCQNSSKIPAKKWYRCELHDHKTIANYEDHQTM